MISFGKVHPIWHRDNADLLDGFCYVQEKVDGSQFSFCMTDGTVRFASRSREIPTDDEGWRCGGFVIRRVSCGLCRSWLALLMSSAWRRFLSFCTARGSLLTAWVG